MKIGWHLAQLDSRDDFVTDAVGYSDFSSTLQERLRHLTREIKSQRYRPRVLLDVEVPKTGLSVRPGNVLPIEESVVLHAISYLMAPRLDRHLSDQVYSYRLHKEWKKRIQRGKDLFQEADREIPFLRRKTIAQFDPMEPWYVAWPDFDRDRRKAAVASGYSHLTKTDITAYFENIDLRLLDAQLRALLPQEPMVLSLLTRILEAWTRTTSIGVSVGRGVPQGNNVSSFLANLYLLPLDEALIRFCRRRRATWYRYVDDVDVFSRDSTTAREAVFVINSVLRSLHLNLQGSKTQIIEGDELTALLDDNEARTIDVAWRALEPLDCGSSKEQPKITQILKPLRAITQRFRRGLPGSVRRMSNKDSRTLRRLMTAYGRCGRPWLQDVAIECLREWPELRMLTKCLRYLSQQRYPLHYSIVRNLLELVEKSELPIPYQVAMVVETIGKMHPGLPGRLVGRLRKIGLGRRVEWLVRQKTGEALASFPVDESRLESDSDHLLEDEHPWVRRAGCSLMTRGGVEFVRRRVRKLVYDPDPFVGRLALYWNRHLDDNKFAIDLISNWRNAPANDYTFLRRVPQLWLLRCSPDREVVRRLREVVRFPRRSVSAKVLWHQQQLLEKTRWAEA